jgi:hypothetical protein
MAWNFLEQMQIHNLKNETFGSLSQTKSTKAHVMIQKFPKLMFKLISQTQSSSSGVGSYGTSEFFFFEKAAGELVMQHPFTYMKCPEALDFFIRGSETKQSLKTCSFWKVNSILRLIKYLSFRFYQQTQLNLLALKPLEYADAKTVIFYLPQLF